ncbi:GNAT family N-acetyltransferase [Rhizomonospora bruguierae]|uniref:GNAT family N-acetyltransferase n=1 Tax=Rhizomonospora bruguierae TaxID=1581705 RepID=UPI001BCB155C|nr:GNAT family N-acetyltransferase [Micromonospora sp. NBRC 107566]
MPSLTLTTLAERSDLADRWDDFPGAWPEFLFHDAVAEALYAGLVAAHPDLCVLALEEGEPDRPVGKGCALPFTPGDGALPATGYDAVLLGAAADRLAGRRGTRISAVEIVVRADRRGRGLSAGLLDALRRVAARRGYRELLAPVRPTGKHLVPEEPMGTYAHRTRPDGLPADPWLRTHVRAGGVLREVAPCSMTVTGTLAQWRAWTGLPFDAPGAVTVPGALVPVHCVPDEDRAVYVEPNVWLTHSVPGSNAVGGSPVLRVSRPTTLGGTIDE